MLEWVHNIADQEHLEKEWEYLWKVFLQNGCSATEVKRTFAMFDVRHLKKQREKEDQIRGVAIVLFYNTVTNRQARLLIHKGIRATLYPLIKLREPF